MAVIKKVSEAVIFMAIGAALFAVNPRMGQGGGIYLFKGVVPPRAFYLSSTAVKAALKTALFM